MFSDKEKIQLLFYSSIFYFQLIERITYNLMLLSGLSTTSCSLKIWLSVSRPSSLRATRPCTELHPSAAETLSSCSSEEVDM